MTEKISEFEQSSSPERERGANITIDFKVIRHGERAKDESLLNLGREITKKRAVESGIKEGDYDAVKAIGSPAGPKQHVEDEDRMMARSVETAHIYAQEVTKGRAYRTRDRDLLNYETLKSKPPYNHIEIYNSYLPDNFEELDDEEHIEAAKFAQQKTFEYLVGLETPEAAEFKKEIAGSFAVIVEHYQEMTKRLRSGYKLLVPAGSHGGTMEFLILETAQSINEEGKVEVGMTSDQIGGDFDPSEAYTVRIQTDENGEQKKLAVTFDNSERPNDEIVLDGDRIHELAESYRELHKE